MKQTQLMGNFSLDTETISRFVGPDLIGVYALGASHGSPTTLNISYVGRSDTDLAGRLKQHVGEYADFQFTTCGSTKLAFEMECRLYHSFNPPDNTNHPARPRWTDYRCPVLGCSY